MQTTLITERLEHFLDLHEPPSASVLGAALTEVDREARRAATALERKDPPRTLFGRGVRLVPPARGLVVEDAEPGSLDVLMMLGGIYSAVTSQPLSFILNATSLLQWGRLGVRTILPGVSGDRRMEVTVAPTHRHAYEETDLSPDTLVLPTPSGSILVSGPLMHVRFTFESADGSKVDFEASPAPSSD